MDRLGHVCRAIQRLAGKYPDKLESIVKWLAYVIHDMRGTYRGERLASTIAGFELRAVAGWLPDTPSALYDLYVYAEHGFDKKWCNRNQYLLPCSDANKAYEYWLSLIEQTTYALALLGLAEPISLEQWLEKTKQPRPKPAKPQTKPQLTKRPRDIIEWLKAIAHG